MLTHPLLKQLGIEGIYVNEVNPHTNAPDSLCIRLRDGTAIVANVIEHLGKEEGIEVVLWKEQSVLSVLNAVDSQQG